MIAAFLVACLPAGLGGDETDGVAAPMVDGFSTDAVPPVGGSDTGVPASGGEPLAVTVDGTDAAVVHTFQEGCSSAFRGASAAVDGQTIRMTYDLDHTDDAPCDWTLRYTLSGIPAGDWTLLARDDSADFTVTP